MTTLYAFYDLKVSPCTFDILAFLYLAEMRRLDQGLDEIELLVVANDEADGFRVDPSKIIQLDNSRWALQHVLLPVGNILPSCRRTVFCSHRDMATEIEANAKHVFPIGYSVEKPIACYTADNVLMQGLRGYPDSTFRAAPEALERVDRWLSHNAADRKPVTITLREHYYHDSRNSDLGEWGKFAQSLDPNIYAPIILRDTDKIFEPSPPEIAGILRFDAAALDLELRAALYERAYLNMFVNNGTCTLARLNTDIRILQFKLLTDAPNATLEYLGKMGWTPDTSPLRLTNHQWHYFEPDTFPFMQEKFDSMVAFIESGAPVVREPWASAETWIERFAKYGSFDHVQETYEILLAETDDPAELQQRLTSVVEQAAERLSEDGYHAEAASGYHLLLTYNEGNLRYITAMIGALSQMNNHGRINVLLDRLEAQKLRLGPLHCHWARLLDSFGRVSDALYHYGAHLEAEPEDLETLVVYAERLGQIGDDAGKRSALEKALELIPMGRLQDRLDVKSKLADSPT